jgi:hypothetical protein
MNLPLRVLANIPGMNSTGKGKEIDFKTIIQGGAVVYFFLPVADDMTAALCTARLAIQSLVSCVQRVTKHAPITVAIDEAQSLISSTMQPFYQQMRKFGISIWTIHQNFQDLAMDRNCMPMVVNNAAIGIHLGVRDPIGREHIEKISGKVQVQRPTVNGEGKISYTPVWEERIKTEDFDLVNNSAGLAFVTINGRAGFASFNHTFICEVAGFTCSWEDFQRHSSTPWPDLEDGVTESDLQSPMYHGRPPVHTPKESALAIEIALAAMNAVHASS